MRRKDRQVTQCSEILEIVGSCKVCRLALQDENGLFIVPVNFGYEYMDGALLLYFHSAKDGRKVGAMANNPAVAYEMDCSHELITGKKACDYGYAYRSIMGCLLYTSCRIM